MEITIPVTLLISLATFLVTVGGTWFVTQKRIRDLERKVSHQDLKYEQIILEIKQITVEINGLKIEIAKVQGSITAMNEKMDLLIHGKIKNY
jgi:cell division protein FtsL